MYEQALNLEILMNILRFSWQRLFKLHSVRFWQD